MPTRPFAESTGPTEAQRGRGAFSQTLVKSPKPDMMDGCVLASGQSRFDEGCSRWKRRRSRDSIVSAESMETTSRRRMTAVKGPVRGLCKYADDNCVRSPLMLSRYRRVLGSQTVGNVDREGV